MRRVKVEVPDSALDQAAQTAIKALKAENTKLKRRLTELERATGDARRLKEALRLMESCATEVRLLGFGEGEWL